jgi:hypothetical protein
VAEIHQAEKLPLNDPARTTVFQTINRDITTEGCLWAPLCQPMVIFVASKNLIGLNAMPDEELGLPPNRDYLQIAKLGRPNSDDYMESFQQQARSRSTQRVFGVPATDPFQSIIIGDRLHNLRSAHNHLARLVLPDAKRPNLYELPGPRGRGWRPSRADLADDHPRRCQAWKLSASATIGCTPIARTRLHPRSRPGRRTRVGIEEVDPWASSVVALPQSQLAWLRASPAGPGDTRLA